MPGFDFTEVGHGIRKGKQKYFFFSDKQCALSPYTSTRPAEDALLLIQNYMNYNSYRLRSKQKSTHIILPTHQTSGSKFPNPIYRHTCLLKRISSQLLFLPGANNFTKLLRTGSNWWIRRQRELKIFFTIFFTHLILRWKMLNDPQLWLYA